MPSIFFILFFVSPAGVQDNKAWTDYLGTAAKENKPVVALFSASWCAPCKRFKSTTLKDPNVRAFLDDKVVFVEMDGEKGEGPDLVKRYRVMGYPTLVIVDKTGALMDKKIGLLPPGEFLGWLRQALPR